MMTDRCIGSLSFSAPAALKWLPALRLLGCRARGPGAGVRTAPTRTVPARSCRGQVEELLPALLVSGEARIEIVAAKMACSRQTLYRRLKAEGVTFEEVLDAVRRRAALRLIGERVPIKEIAYRLGFSDPSAFSRAFKRWTGSSPSRI